MKCISCGKQEAVKDNLCKDCFMKKNPIIKEIKDINLNICTICHKLFINTIRVKNLDSELTKEISKKIKFNNFNYNILKYNIEILNFKEYLEQEKNQGLSLHDMNNIKFIEAIVEIYFKINDKENKEQFKLEIPVNKFICKDCSKLAGNYFEGTLQIRTKSKEIYDFLNKDIKTIEIKNKTRYVTEIKNTTNGKDYYFNNQKIMIKIAKRTQSTFGGIIEYSYHLHSKDIHASKDIYRMNIVYKNKIKKNAVFVQDGKLFKMCNPGKTNKVLDVENNKTTSMKIKDIKNIKILKPEVKRVIKKYPILTIIDENFQEKEVIDKNKKEITNNKIKVVEFNNKIWRVD